CARASHAVSLGMDTCGQKHDRRAATRPPLQRGAATPQTVDRNDDQYRTESADDRCARRQVPPERQKQTSDSADECNDPTDEQTITNTVGEIDSANRGRNEITKDEQNAGDANEACQHQAENGVEAKVTPAHTQ